MTDKSYTKLIRDTVERDGAATGSLFTEDEVMWLLNRDMNDTSDEVITMTEHVIERSTGLRVDLSSQGPARLAITKAGKSDNQEHNMFTVIDDTRNHRSFHDVNRDRHSIPNITPQDSNVGTRSLDFPSTRPHGTAIDGLRIDDKENPVEQAMVTQFSVAQILHYWGVNVHELCDWIDHHWGIDYAWKVVTNIALAKPADLDAFIASGGRPPPAAYFSPNVFSRYMVTQSPSVDPTQVGYTSAFLGRAKVISKFVLATVNEIRGRGALMEIRTHCNPAFMSTFDPKSLTNWNLGIGDQKHSSVYKALVASKDTYDEFINHRQAALVAERNHRLAIARAVMQAEMMARSKLDDYARFRLLEPAKSIMSGEQVSTVASSPPHLVGAPSKVTTILFHMFHGEALPGKYGSLITTNAELALLSALPSATFNLARAWKTVYSGRGLGECVKSLNVSEAEILPEVRLIISQNPGMSPRMLAGLYLIKRQVPLMRDLARGVIDQCHAWALENATPLGVVMPSNVRVGMLKRVWRVFLAIAENKYKPAKYLPRYRAVATSEGANCSLLEVSDATLGKLLGGEQSERMRPLFSGLRGYWIEYYRKASREWQRVCYMSGLLTEDMPRFQVIPKKLDSATGKDARFDFMSHAFYTEAVYNTAAELAYKWHTVSIWDDQVPSIDEEYQADVLAGVVKSYIDRLLLDKPLLLQVDPNTAKLREKNKMSTDFDEKVTFLLSAYFGKFAGQTKLRGLVKRHLEEAYHQHTESVRSTVQEAIEKDKIMITSEMTKQNEVITTPTIEEKPEPAVDKKPSAVMDLNLNTVLEQYVGKTLKSEDSLSDEGKLVRDRFAGASDYVFDVDESLYEIMETIVDTMDDRMFNKDRDEFEELGKVCRRMAGSDIEVVEFELKLGFKHRLLALAERIGIDVVDSDVMV